MDGEENVEQDALTGSVEDIGVDGIVKDLVGVFGLDDNDDLVNGNNERKLKTDR